MQQHPTATRALNADKIRVQKEFAGLHMYYYHREIDETVLGMYYRDVADLPCEDVIRALEALRRDPKRRHMPLPADVRAIVAPQNDSPIAAANQIAGSIVDAIARFGYMRGADARMNLGELAWCVVKAKGGWQVVCTINANDSAFFAQCRELALSYGAGTARAKNYEPPKNQSVLPAKSPENSAEKGLLSSPPEDSKREIRRILESFGLYL